MICHSVATDATTASTMAGGAKFGHHFWKIAATDFVADGNIPTVTKAGWDAL